MRKHIWLALLFAIPALIFISPAAVFAVQNNEVALLSTQTAQGDFFSVFDWYVWVIIGIILAIVIVFLIFMFALPKKKKGEPFKADKQPKKGAAGGMDKKFKPQVVAPVAPRAQQMPREFPQTADMPGRMYPGEPVPNQAEGAQFPQMPAQPEPMQPMQPRPMPRPVQAQPAQPAQPQQVPPRPPQYQPPPAPQMPPQAARQQPVQAQPRPMQPPPAAPGAPQRATPQPIQQPRPGMPRQPMAPQPRFTPPGQYPPSAAPRMEFIISNFSIIPLQVKEGDPVTISATVTNNGQNLSNYSMVFRVNHVVEKIIDISLGPGSSQTSTITVTRETAGQYFVEADGSRGVFTVIERAPAAFTIGNLSIVPERLKQGQPIAISFMVTNTGERQGTYNAVLNIKGMSEATENIPVEPGETKAVTFNIVKDTAGFFPVAVEHLSGRFVVEMDWRE